MRDDRNKTRGQPVRTRRLAPAMGAARHAPAHQAALLLLVSLLRAEREDADQRAPEPESSGGALAPLEPYVQEPLSHARAADALALDVVGLLGMEAQRARDDRRRARRPENNMD